MRDPVKGGSAAGTGSRRALQRLEKAIPWGRSWACFNGAAWVEGGNVLGWKRSTAAHSKGSVSAAAFGDKTGGGC